MLRRKVYDAERRLGLEILAHTLQRDRLKEVMGERDDKLVENVVLRTLIQQAMAEWLREPDGNAYMVLEEGFAFLDKEKKA